MHTIAAARQGQRQCAVRSDTSVVHLRSAESGSPLRPSSSLLRRFTLALLPPTSTERRLPPMVSRELRWVRMEWPASNTCFVTAAVRFPLDNSLTQQHSTASHNKLQASTTSTASTNTSISRGLSAGGGGWGVELALEMMSTTLYGKARMCVGRTAFPGHGCYSRMYSRPYSCYSYGRSLNRNYICYISYIDPTQPDATALHQLTSSCGTGAYIYLAHISQWHVT